MPDMIDLSRNPAGRRDDYYDVIADGVVVVGRIMLFSATPAKLPWVWTIRGRPLTHPRLRGNSRSRDAGIR